MEALAPEREALWARMERTSFLSDAEKRAAVGYGDKPEGGDSATGPFARKYREDQARDDQGRWVDEGGGEGSGEGDNTGPREFTLVWEDPQTTLLPPEVEPDEVPAGAPVARPSGTNNPLLVPVADRPGYPVDIIEEDAKGGHTFNEHVNKSADYLKNRILSSRGNYGGIFEYGLRRAGSFTSIDSANKLINSTLSQNQEKVSQFVAGRFPMSLPRAYIHGDFDTPTGYEAYTSGPRSQPNMRPTYGVTVQLLRDPTSGSGFRVHSAWPTNRD